MNNVALKPLILLGSIAGYVALTASTYLAFVVKESKKDYHDDCDYLMIRAYDSP